MTKTDRPRAVHGLAMREALDKILLLAAGILGVAGGLALKALNAPILAPALFSAGVLFAYVLLTWAIGKLKLDPETIGDNCYYLGFIFTLASLAYTLYGLSRTPEDITLISDIVSGFGVALSSTIIGVMLRVFLLQFRPDMVAKDRETRITLQSATRDYRTALAQSTTALKQFSLETQQKLAEHHERMRADGARATEDQRRRIAEDARQSGEALQKAAMDAARQSIGAIEAVARASAARSEKAALDSAERTRMILQGFAVDMAQVIDALNVRTAALARAGDEAGDSVSAGAERLQEAMERFTASIETATPGIEDSARRMAEATRAVAAAAEEAAQRDPGAASRAAARTSRRRWPWRWFGGDR